jgi:hypothetical protein
MAGSSYLGTLLKILPAEQTRQIVELLNELQNSGSISNPQEFNDKLKKLTSVVNKEGRILPTFELHYALPLQVCRSSLHNGMLRSAKNDIQSAFLQTNEIGEKLEDHNALFIQNLIKDLEQSVSHQEETIKRLEWLADKSNEFRHAIVDEFKSARSTYRSSLESEKIYDLYFDDRTNGIQSELFHDFAGQKLIISPKNTVIIRPTSVQHLSDQYSFHTEHDVEDPANKLNNLLDGQRGTFWTRNVYLSEKKSKVTTVLQFDLDTAKDISYLYIESGTSEPFSISSVLSVSPEGNQISLLSEKIEVDGRIRIDFDNVLTKSVIVFFETTTYKKEDYFTRKDVEILDVFESEDVFSRLLKKEKLGQVTRQVVFSDTLADACLIPEDTVAKEIQSYKYTFSLDNVWFGNENYNDSGMFVSKPLSIESVGTVGINVKESINSFGGVSDSIEYDITRVDNYPSYRVTTLPVPPANITSVTSERLIFTGQLYDSTVNDLCFLRFCPLVPHDWTIGDDNPIKVYKNGELLAIGTDWELSVKSIDSGTGHALSFESSFLNITDFSEWNLLPQKMYIVIKNIDPNAVYTANYNIRFSDSVNSDTVWLDKEKTAWLNKDKIVFKKENSSINSDLYLIVKMRRNLASKYSTPKLHEYSLLGSSYN